MGIFDHRLKQEMIDILKATYGQNQVWTEEDAHQDFTIGQPVGGGMVYATRRSDGVAGTLQTYNYPKLYYDFQF